MPDPIPTTASAIEKPKGCTINPNFIARVISDLLSDINWHGGPCGCVMGDPYCECPRGRRCKRMGERDYTESSSESHQ